MGNDVSPSLCLQKHTQEEESEGECKWESMVDVENEPVVQKSIQSKQKKSVQVDFGSVWCLLTHLSSRFPYKWKTFNPVFSYGIRTEGMIYILVWGNAAKNKNQYRY